MAEVECPRCERLLTLPRRQDVRRIRCQACGEVFVYTTPAPTLDDQVLDWLNEDRPREDDGDDLVTQVQASVAAPARGTMVGRPTT